jgi:Fe-S oxidoreductase
MNLIQLRKLSYDEVAKCNKCGFCLPNCPVYLVEGKESSAPRGRNAITRAVIEGGLEWSPEIEQSIFSCLGCGACTAACFPKVKTKDLVFRNRECLVNEGLYPKIADQVAKFLEEKHNISDLDNQDRSEWKEKLRDLPQGALEKAKAEVIYFVGCVASFFPTTKKIPIHMARIMTKADVDFTVLGGEEWCCGFPFIGMGTPDKMLSLMQHNVEKIEEVGAKSVVFTCPSCYHTWKHLYQMPGVELKHSTQMLYDLVKDKRIKLKEMNVTVTYHDPCDLGRNSGIFEEPRQVLKSIPGLKLVEMAYNRQLSMCCGGGGNVEMVNPELSAKVAEMKLGAIADTKADLVVSSCQQCLRTIATNARRNKVNLVVKDLTELVFEAME